MTSARDDTNRQNLDDLIFWRSSYRTTRSTGRIRNKNCARKTGSERGNKHGIGTVGKRLTTGIHNLRVNNLDRTHNNLHRDIAIATTRQIHNYNGTLATGKTTCYHLQYMLDLMRIKWHGT